MRTVEQKPKFCKRKLLLVFATLSKLYLEPATTLTAKNTRQFDITILSTIIDDVHVIGIVQFYKEVNNHKVQGRRIRH